MDGEYYYYVDRIRYYFDIRYGDLLLKSLNLLFQNFKIVCKNIGNSWRNRRKTVEKFK